MKWADNSFDKHRFNNQRGTAEQHIKEETLLLDLNDAGSRPDLPTSGHSGDRIHRSGQQSLLDGQI